MSFEERVLKAAKPTVVMFWQQGCEPCKAMVPVLIEAARERSGIEFTLEGAEDIKARYNVTACPTLTVFKEGKPIGRWMGFTPKEKVLNWIDRTVANA
jgi:thioredoxin-like negative regulator of GroEL